MKRIKNIPRYVCVSSTISYEERHIQCVILRSWLNLPSLIIRSKDCTTQDCNILDILELKCDCEIWQFYGVFVKSWQDYSTVTVTIHVKSSAKRCTLSCNICNQETILLHCSPCTGVLWSQVHCGTYMRFIVWMNENGVYTTGPGQAKWGPN